MLGCSCTVIQYSTFKLPSNEHIFIALSRYRSIKSLNQFEAQAAKLEWFSPESSKHLSFRENHPCVTIFAQIFEINILTQNEHHQQQGCLQQSDSSNLIDINNSSDISNDRRNHLRQGNLQQ